MAIETEETVETILDTNQRIADLVGSIKTIIPLPEVAARIVAVVNDPSSTPRDLQRLVSHDPALVSQLLQRVNSSFYAQRNRVDSVERAILLLGFETVQSLAITATLGQIFKPVNLCDDFTARDLWLHCVAVAATARALAMQVCKPMAERAFLAGLMHDVGLLGELQVCPEKLREVCQAAKTSKVPFSTLEYELIGCNHAELGGAMARQWGFPDACRAAAAYHHHLALAGPEERELVGLVYAADTLCCDDAIGFNLTAAGQFTDTAGSVGLLPLDVIESTREHLPELISDVVMVLGAS